MKTAKVLACCLLTLLLVGAESRSVPASRARPLAAEEQSTRRKPLLARLDGARSVMAAGRYSDAAKQFSSLIPDCQGAGQLDLAARAAGNVGGCQFALHQYQAALRSFLDARRMAVQAEEDSAVLALDANIASLLTEMGDLPAAAQWIGGALDRLSPHDPRAPLPQLLLQIATIRARQGRMSEALDLFRRGIDAAERTGNLELCAIGWNRLGEEYFKRRDFARAEPPLLKAFYIRKLNHLALDTSYRNLGRLRLAEGDLRSASALLDRAVELSTHSPSPIPTWDMYHSRGRVRLAQGRLPEALADLRIAVDLARDWRWSLPPEDAARLYAEGWLDQVHSALIEAGNRLYLHTHNPALVRETFDAAEENRASSLLALAVERRTAPDLPPSYWETLARLQSAEVQALRTNSPQSLEALRADRAEILRMESALVPVSQPVPSALLERTQAALDSQSALLSFHLGDSASWLWAVDRAGILLYALPPKQEIESQIQAAVHAVRDHLSAPLPADTRLFRTLFGSLAPRFRRKPRWLLAVDESLFDVPVAALREETSLRPVYVAERHVIEVIPGAGCWLEALVRRPAPPLSPVFLGIGDPIYNAADPRLPRRVWPSLTLAAPWRLFAASASGAESPVLPRLVASAKELEACSRAWSGGRILLQGADANGRELAEQIRCRPEIVHFATHFLRTSSPPFYSTIALSLAGQGRTELLQPLEIARWRIQAGVVALSGCHSAAGAAPLTSGMIGLTRAWLMAGARSVVGSRWDTPDESGALFTAFYRNLKAQRRIDPASALREAQLEMLRTTDWRANPRYWGAYFDVGTQ